MNEDRLCIDLCSGLGGFSRAFVDAGWEVITLDWNKKFNPTILGDVRQLGALNLINASKKGTLGLVDYERIHIHSSPPCDRFSFARRAWPERGIRSACDTIGACLEITAEIRMLVSWTEDRSKITASMENPKGRLRWILGKPDTTVKLSDYGAPYKKSTDLWTWRFTLPLLESTKPYTSSMTSYQNKGKGSTGLLRIRDPEQRAKLPLGLSQAILETVSGEGT